MRQPVNSVRQANMLVVAWLEGFYLFFFCCVIIVVSLLWILTRPTRVIILLHSRKNCSHIFLALMDFCLLLFVCMNVCIVCIYVCNNCNNTYIHLFKNYNKQNLAILWSSTLLTLNLIGHWSVLNFNFYYDFLRHFL